MRPSALAVLIPNPNVVHRVLRQVGGVVRLQEHLEHRRPAELHLLVDWRCEVVRRRDLDVLLVHPRVVRMRIGGPDDLRGLVDVGLTVGGGDHRRSNGQLLPFLSCEVVRLRHLPVLDLAALDVSQSMMIKPFDKTFVNLAHGVASRIKHRMFGLGIS